MNYLARVMKEGKKSKKYFRHSTILMSILSS